MPDLRDMTDEALVAFAAGGFVFEPDSAAPWEDALDELARRLAFERKVSAWLAADACCFRCPMNDGDACIDEASDGSTCKATAAACLSAARTAIEQEEGL